jgi:hypothetical protein
MDHSVRGSRGAAEQALEVNEAKFAAVFDRLDPVLQNYINEGFTWKKKSIGKIALG